MESTASGRDALTSSALESLTPAQLVDVIVAREKQIAEQQALQMAAVAEFARPGRCGAVSDLMDTLTEKGGRARNADGSVNVDALEVLLQEEARRLASAEIAAALVQSSIGAGRRVDFALELVDELPSTWNALRDGRIDRVRACVIAERTRVLDPELRAEVEARVLPLAVTRTPGKLKPMIDRRVVAADPDAARKRTARARQGRFVEHVVGEGGMGLIRANLPAEGAVAVTDLLDSIAAATAGQDDRPMAARRADALVDICVALLTTGHVDVGTAAGSTNEPETDCTTTVPDKSATARPSSDRPPMTRVVTHHGHGAHLNVTMTAAACAGLADHPAELAGYGVITADVARMLARSIRSLAVVVLDDHGHASAVGRTVYAPTQMVAGQVIIAAGTCRFPGCRQPAASCDLDHRDPFDHELPQGGGATDPSNLDPLCRNHHLLKTHGGWRSERRDRSGPTLIWTSPTGHRYSDSPREFTVPVHEQPLHDERHRDQRCADDQRSGEDEPCAEHQDCPEHQRCADDQDCADDIEAAPGPAAITRQLIWTAEQQAARQHSLRRLARLRSGQSPRPPTAAMLAALHRPPRGAEGLRRRSTAATPTSGTGGRPGLHPLPIEPPF